MTDSLKRIRDTARRVLRDHHGVAHISAFLGAGLTRLQVAALLNNGLLVRPRIGWYADPSLEVDAVRALRVGGPLACVSAAQSWGIATPEGHARHVHVSISPGTTRLRRSDDATRRARAGDEFGVRWHWEQLLEPAVGWRVSPIDAILQLAACVEDFRWLVAAIDSARNGTLGDRLLDDDATQRLRDALPEHLRRAVDLSDPAAESSGESFIRLGIQEIGIPFQTQQWLTGMYRVDILVDGWLPVESDGMEVHSGREAVARDRERDGTLAYLGTPPLRFSQTQAVRDTAFVVETVRRVWLRGRDTRQQRRA